MHIQIREIHVGARIRERTHAHNYTRSQLVGHCQRNESDTHHDYTPLTHLESSDCVTVCVCERRKRVNEIESEKTATTATAKVTTAKCSVSIINSDDSKGISFVFKCFNLLLFATFEVGTTFPYCELNFQNNKSLHNGNGFLSYYFEFFAFFLLLFHSYSFHFSPPHHPAL